MVSAAEDAGHGPLRDRGRRAELHPQALPAGGARGAAARLRPVLAGARHRRPPRPDRRRPGAPGAADGRHPGGHGPQGSLAGHGGRRPRGAAAGRRRGHRGRRSPRRPASPGPRRSATSPTSPATGGCGSPCATAAPAAPSTASSGWATGAEPRVAVGLQPVAYAGRLLTHRRYGARPAGGEPATGPAARQVAHPPLIGAGGSGLADDEHRARGQDHLVAGLDLRADRQPVVGGEHHLAGVDPLVLGDLQLGRLGGGVEPDQERPVAAAARRAGRGSAAARRRRTSRPPAGSSSCQSSPVISRPARVQPGQVLRAAARWPAGPRTSAAAAAPGARAAAAARPW